MKRTRHLWKLAVIALGTLLPLVALGCNSTKQYPSAFEIDRSGWAARIAGKESAAWQDRRDSESDRARPAVANKGRVDEMGRW